MFQDAAGTVPVTAISQPVGRILDKSGRGNHATQSTNGKRPTLSQSVSGKYYLAFDGLDDALQTPSLSFAASDKVLIGVGARKINDTTGIVCELTGNASSNPGTFYFASGTNGASYVWSSFSHVDVPANNSQIGGSTTVSGTDLAVLTSYHNITLDSTTFRRNAVERASGFGDKGTGNFAAGILYIGARAGTSLFFNGDLYGLVVRGTAASVDQISLVEQYLNNKTGAY